jgi:transposase
MPRNTSSVGPMQIFERQHHRLNLCPGHHPVGQRRQLAAPQFLGRQSRHTVLRQRHVEERRQQRAVIRRIELDLSERTLQLGEAPFVREIVNGIFYVMRAGCPWRLLPNDLPPWGTIYRWFAVWRDDGCFERINHALVMADRERVGRDASPSAAIIEWQAASPPSTHAFLLVGTLFLLPVILMYTGWSYWVFRGKVRADV